MCKECFQWQQERTDRQQREERWQILQRRRKERQQRKQRMQGMRQHESQNVDEVEGIYDDEAFKLQEQQRMQRMRQKRIAFLTARLWQAHFVVRSTVVGYVAAAVVAIASAVVVVVDVAAAAVVVVIASAVVVVAGAHHGREEVEGACVRERLAGEDPQADAAGGQGGDRQARAHGALHERAAARASRGTRRYIDASLPTAERGELER